MAQQLGRVERPPADQYKNKRKLLLVPLLQSVPSIDDEGMKVLNRYWDQVKEQLQSLQTQMGNISIVYCENLPEGGESGLEQLKHVDENACNVVSNIISSGSELQSIEDIELLSELIDLQRFLTVPISSQKVASRMQEWYSESNKARYENIAKVIDETLKSDLVGLILAGERHQIQFPQDIEVFYVAPPALDEFHKWIQQWLARKQEEFVSSIKSQSEDSIDIPSD
jgi:hypothetical protein